MTFPEFTANCRFEEFGIVRYNRRFFTVDFGLLLLLFLPIYFLFLQSLRRLSLFDVPIWHVLVLSVNKCWIFELIYLFISLLICLLGIKRQFIWLALNVALRKRINLIQLLVYLLLHHVYCLLVFFGRVYVFKLLNFPIVLQHLTWTLWKLLLIVLEGIDSFWIAVCDL